MPHDRPDNPTANDGTGNDAAGSRGGESLAVECAEVECTNAAEESGDRRPALADGSPASSDPLSTLPPGALQPVSGAVADSEATWDPRLGDPPDCDDPWGTDAVASRAPDTRAESADPDATFLPSGGRSVDDIWGEVFNDATSGCTLKNPRRHTNRPTAVSVHRRPQGDGINISIEGYDLLDVIGEGGVGVVYRARQKSVDRHIAVKMIKSTGGWDLGEKDRFIAEALITAKLDHPNIVPIHDLSRTQDDEPFYTMKMVRGTPWSEVIETKSLGENLAILLDVCDAVSFAHSRRVIHRDIKPENVMLGEFGEVQLMDWGMGANISEAGILTGLTGGDAAGGTPSYMAPEMVTGEDGPIGIHSDVYLLGAVLYELVTGNPPHPGKRALDTLQHAHNNTIAPTEQKGLLLDIALKAMQTHPADRHPSVAAFKQALVEYQSHAESILLWQRSSEALSRASETHNYDLFARALFGFREALGLWAENAEARQGIVDTQLAYARSAYGKGDLDLAGSTLDPDCAAHRELMAEIREAQNRRLAARRRLRALRIAAASLTLAVVVILTVASIWINRAKRQAVTAKEAAVAAREAETQQRQRAESAMSRAQAEEARAVKAYQDLLAAQEEERRAKAQAEASKTIANNARDELARTGMLRDNSWWVFDAATARAKQEEAAKALGSGVERSIPLADGVELAMVLVPAGEFVMGSPAEEEKRAADEHLHRVRLTHAFYLGKYELTETQWQTITGEPPPGLKDRQADPKMPLTGVPFAHVAERLLPAIQARAPEGFRFRLPTEAEWEYACRAGAPTAYFSGADGTALESAGWSLSNSGRELQPVGGKTPNAFGLYDMLGNAAEMCADPYLPGFYLESPGEDPLASGEGEIFVVRGGSMMNMPEHCRAAYRSYVYVKNKYAFLGLRLALVPGRDEATPPASAPASGPAEDPTP